VRRFEEALREAEFVIARPNLTQRAYCAAEWIGILSLIHANRPEAARTRAEFLLAGRGPAVGDSALAGALTALAFVAWDEARIADAIGLLRAAAERAKCGDGDGWRAYPWVALVAVLAAIGEDEEAAAVAQECQHETERIGDQSWEMVPSVCRVCLHVAAGRLEQAAVAAERALAGSEAAGVSFFAPIIWCGLAGSALQRDDLDGAERALAECRARTSSADEAFGLASYVWVEARLAWSREREGGSASVAPDGYRLDRVLLEQPGAAGWFARTATAQGDRPAAERVVRTAERLAELNGDIAAFPAAAMHARGVLERDPAILQLAASEHRSLWARGSAHEDAAALWVETDGQRARSQLKYAAGAYHAAGAVGDARRVLERLGEKAEVGLRRRRRQSDVPCWGWASLTGAELRVACVVSEGLTNTRAAARLCISRHTVDFHLRQIYRKLGITSRVALTRIVLEREVL
jgi:DNA-binding CsgD family transcriptional regulator